MADTAKYWLIFNYYCFIVGSINVFGIKVKPMVEFEGKKIVPHPSFLPEFRYEQAERNTSEHYTLWDEAKLKWIEWPGNVTELNVDFPILKWGKKRAKLIQNSCNKFLGPYSFAYAYDHVHLTFGPFRITTSYCPPLTIPRKILRQWKSKSDSAFIETSDFEFVPDSLLVIIESKFVVRVGPLEINYRMEGKTGDHWKLLTHQVATGITSPVDKLVTQNCCSKFDVCKTGDVVLAYKERSTNFIIFISTDSGASFQGVKLSKRSDVLHAVLSFPTLGKLLAFHGNGTEVGFDTFSMKSGRIFENNATKDSRLQMKGKVQAAKFGQEFSFLVWDQCRVWYSPDAGKSLTAANFYINNDIRKNVKNRKHAITPTHCFLAEESAISYDETGKVGLTDSSNNFFYGIDTKEIPFNLVAAKLDISLLERGKEKSIVPHFDFNNRPKLMYPPRFLRIVHPAVQRPDYVKRLAMRLFPKTVFPSDYMPPFYTEHIPSQYKSLGIPGCQVIQIIKGTASQSSGIRADKSISQKPKIYTVSEYKPLKFVLEFRSTSNSTGQLKFEPSFYSQFLKIRSDIFELTKLGYSKWYHFKYRISIEPRLPVFTDVQYRLNFYTKKSIRCVHQPNLIVWIKVVRGVNSPKDESNNVAADSVRVSENYLTGKNLYMDGNTAKLSSCGAVGKTMKM